MDPGVLQSIARWPDVPAVYGWLGLDRRGQWRLRGERITHPGAIAFINRNYEAGEDGCWYFQNGPQRVYVDLDYTPWVYRFDVTDGFSTHTGRPAGEPAAAWLDDAGAVLLECAPGIGVVDDRDLARLAELLLDPDRRGCEATGPGTLLAWHGRELALGTIRAAGVAPRFGFVARPRAD